MGTKTGLIRFNVKDRGRRHRGQDRNFDTAALAALINGGVVQEQVKNGDLVGYYGHWPRVRFGMDVQEGTIVGGKAVHLEPAIRTTSLRAYPDGTIEHEAEFLDTAPGRLAERLYGSKAGGFSSAITAPRVGAAQVPTGFHGFDYVLEPNYTANRGYALDSAGNRVEAGDLDEEQVAVLDEVGQYAAMVESTVSLLERAQAEYDRLAETLDAVMSENADMAGQLAKVAREPRAPKPEPEATPAAAAVVVPEPVDRAAVLDDARQRGVPAARSRFADADQFIRATLVPVEATDETEGVATAADRVLDRILGNR